MINTYKYFVTPLKKYDTYGTPLEITDDVYLSNLSNVKQAVDSGNYDIGLYTYSNITITLNNITGKFSSENNSSSIFPVGRDKAKIVIKYVDFGGTENTIYQGIINDEATLQNFDSGEVVVKVLSRDSIFRKIKVPGGLINNNITFSEAIKTLLNRPSITSLMAYDATKITVGYDGYLNSSLSFTNKTTRDVLDQLLLASGSIFYIDTSNKMVVKNRDYIDTTVTELFGPGDVLGRDSILKLTNYNSGLQRTFNTISVNDNFYTDDDYVNRYGIGSKNFNFDFITSETTAKEIAEYYVTQFKQPKYECEVVVKTELVKDLNILYPVKLNYGPRYKPYKNNKVPLAGSTIAGQDYYPHILNNDIIYDNILWKVIAIDSDVKNYTTKLKIREV